MDSHQFKRLCLTIWHDFLNEELSYNDSATHNSTSDLSFGSIIHKSGSKSKSKPEPKSDRARELFEMYQEMRKDSKLGALMLKIDFLETIRSRQEVIEKWLSASQICDMFDNNYRDIFSESNNGSSDELDSDHVAYIIPVLAITGSSDFFNGDFVYPSMMIINCLIKIVKEGDEYKLMRSEKFFTNKVVSN